MFSQPKRVIEIGRHHTTQTVGSRIRIKEDEEILKSLDLSIIARVKDVLPDISREGRHQVVLTNESSPIMT